MKRILVWDIPTRLFHWLLAAAFLGAFIIANVVHHRSPTFPVHMLLGGTVLFMVLLRVVWGFVGSQYSRFGSFFFRPGEVLGYFKTAFKRDGKRHIGHNPGSSVAIFAMLFLLTGLALTGAFMAEGGEIVGEIHQVLAWTTLAVVVVHVAGVIVHTVKKRENIALSMIHGKKDGEERMAIPSARPIVGVVFLALTGLWMGGLYNGWDSAKHQVTLPLVGTTLKIGDGEEHEHHKERGEEEGERDHDDDDD